MTNETKKLFDAPWEIRPCNVGYDVVSAYNSIAEDRIFVAHADSKSTANRLARLPELYDALVEAVSVLCETCSMTGVYHVHADYIMQNGCPRKNKDDKCRSEKWMELLKKVRDGEWMKMKH